MEQNPCAEQATNFAMKSQRLRQINQLKEAKLTTSLKQAENFAEKELLVRPKKSRADCWKLLLQILRL